MARKRSVTSSDRACRIVVAVAALVLTAKIPDQGTGERDIQFVSLALVADVHAELVLDRARPFFLAEIFFGTAA